MDKLVTLGQFLRGYWNLVDLVARKHVWTDDTFAIRYGIPLTDGKCSVFFSLWDGEQEFVAISADDTVQSVVEKLSKRSTRYGFSRDVTGRIIAFDKRTNRFLPGYVMVYDSSFAVEYCYTPSEQLSPVFGDVASEAEVAEMLDDVFGAAE